MTTRIELQAEDAQYLVRAVLPAASKDDITPIIAGALWQVRDGEVTLVATDRYRVHRARSEATVFGDGDFIVPNPVLRWMTRNIGLFGRKALVGTSTVTVTFIPADAPAGPSNMGTVEVKVAEADSPVSDSVTYFGHLVPGTYPPVQRLFEQAEQAERETGDPKLRMEFLAAAHHLAAYREETPRVKWTASENPNKPGPLLITYSRGEALVQPNLDLDRR